MSVPLAVSLNVRLLLGEDRLHRLGLGRKRERRRGEKRKGGRKERETGYYIGGESNETRNTRQHVYVSVLRCKACVKYNHHLN